MEQLSSHWADFHKIWYFSTFKKSVEKFQVSLTFDKNDWYFTRSAMYVCDNISPIVPRMRNVSDKFVEKITTHIINSRVFLRKSYRLWHEVEKYGRTGQATDDNIIRSVRFARCITKLQAHWGFYFPRQKYLRERALCYFHTYIAPPPF
jgi:hypothetical protein